MPRPSRKRTPQPRALLVALIALAALAAAVLPTAGRAEESAESPLRAGAWAAEFEIDPSYRYEFGFSSGVTISLKRHHSARSALRFGASVGYGESKSEGESSFERYYVFSNPNYRAGQGVNENHSESHAYGLFLHLQRHHPMREALSIFWEVGPSVRYSEWKSSTENIYPYSFEYGPGEIYQDSRSSVRRSVSLDLSLGFEWFFNRRLSLGARFGGWGGYTWGEETSTFETFTTDDSYYRLSRDRDDLEGVSVQTSPATVTLSAYF